jgi:hypothetical protein
MAFPNPPAEDLKHLESCDAAGTAEAKPDVKTLKTYLCA